MLHSAVQSPLRVAVAGATGLLGSALVEYLRAGGHRVQRLVRGSPTQPDDIQWNPASNRLDAKALDGADAIVNLAGEAIDQRWTSEAKRAIRDSRVQPTTLLARTIASLSSPPRVLVNASAIGIYGNRGDEELEESSRPGDDFLAAVCVEWESAAVPAKAAGTRLVFARSGLVLSPRGGALARLLLPFRMSVGGRTGPGTQWMSWIALEDHRRAIEFAIVTDALSGAVNVASPNPVMNEEFAKTLGRVLGRPAIIPTPTFALELLFGREMPHGTLLASQRVRPRALLEAGFEFRQPTLEGALRAML